MVISRGWIVPQRMDGTAYLFSHAESAHRHAKLRHCVRDVGSEPAWMHDQRRGVVQDLASAGGLLQVRDAGLRRDERAAHVHLVHEVVPASVPDEVRGPVRSLWGLRTFYL